MFTFLLKLGLSDAAAEFGQADVQLTTKQKPTGSKGKHYLRIGITGEYRPRN
jgi:hypothetical protein